MAQNNLKMKKIFSAIIALLLVSSLSFAQGGGAKPAPNKKMEKKDGVMQPKPAAKPHMKKDGTPDMRYKENKEAKPTKKDGTPDMRHKENKGMKPMKKDDGGAKK